MASIMERPKITIREEANAITVWAFRNGFIEKLHAGKHSELLDNPEYSRITDPEIMRINIETSSMIAKILIMRDTNPVEYWKNITFFLQYCEKWEK
jgi:hypothetical protein